MGAQIEIAKGASLMGLGLDQDSISTRGFAIQTRVTTEDAASGFRPDTGRIEVYRSSGGQGSDLTEALDFLAPSLVLTMILSSLNVPVSVETLVCKWPT